MIPANIDQVQILADLNRWGLGDYKITQILGFSEGYIAQLKCGNIGQMSQQRAARLWNFWWPELRNHEPQVFERMVLGEITERIPYLSPVGRLQIHTLTSTT